MKMLEVLLAAGASLDMVDMAGRTALHIAAMCLHVDACQWLLEVRCCVACVVTGWRVDSPVVWSFGVITWAQHADPKPVGANAPVDLLGMTPAAAAGTKWSEAMLNHRLLHKTALSSDPEYAALGVRTAPVMLFAARRC